MGYMDNLVLNHSFYNKKPIAVTPQNTTGSWDYSPVLSFPKYSENANYPVVAQTHIFKIVVWGNGVNEEVVCYVSTSSGGTIVNTRALSSTLSVLLTDQNGILTMYVRTKKQYTYINVFLELSDNPGFITPMSNNPFTITSATLTSQNPIYWYQVNSNTPDVSAITITLSGGWTATANSQNKVIMQPNGTITVILDITNSTPSAVDNPVIGTISAGARPPSGSSVPFSVGLNVNNANSYGLVLYSSGQIQIFGALNATRIVANFTYAV